MTTDRATTATCEWCGDSFDVPHGRGPTPRYCKQAHRQRAYESRRPTPPLLDEDERAVMEQTSAVYNAVVAWGLRANGEELAAAIHVIQGFIVHHALQREDPEGGWTPWFAPPSTH